VLELSAILAATNCGDFIESGAAVNAVGQSQLGGAFVVPQSEVWLVKSFSLVATTLVGEALEVKATMWRNNAAGQNFLREGPLAGKTAAGVTSLMSSMAGPFWISSGETFGAYVQSITTAGNITINGKVNMLRCRR
jgi:hypothetical protein